MAGKRFIQREQVTILRYTKTKVTKILLTGISCKLSDPSPLPPPFTDQLINRCAPRQQPIAIHSPTMTWPMVRANRLTNPRRSSTLTPTHCELQRPAPRPRHLGRNHADQLRLRKNNYVTLPSKPSLPGTLFTQRDDRQRKSKEQRRRLEHKRIKIPRHKVHGY